MGLIIKYASNMLLMDHKAQMLEKLYVALPSGLLLSLIARWLRNGPVALGGGGGGGGGLGLNRTITHSGKKIFIRTTKLG